MRSAPSSPLRSRSAPKSLPPPGAAAAAGADDAPCERATAPPGRFPAAAPAAAVDAAARNAADAGGLHWRSLQAWYSIVPEISGADAPDQVTGTSIENCFS